MPTTLQSMILKKIYHSKSEDKVAQHFQQIRRSAVMCMHDII